MNDVKGVTKTVDAAELKCFDCDFQAIWGTTKLDSLKRAARRHAKNTGHTVQVVYARKFIVTKV